MICPSWAIFKTNRGRLPVIHNLTEDTVKGNLFVSVKGGNTANTEFEFLTGHSMAFLAPGQCGLPTICKSGDARI